jgi:hypothetical protein
LMMVSILASLLIIIFSFSFAIIIGVLVLNTSLFVVLTWITHNPQIFQMTNAFPKILSNKKTSGFDYEQD